MLFHDFYGIGLDGSVAASGGSYASRLQHTTDHDTFIQLNAKLHTKSINKGYGLLAALYLLQVLYRY